ncbi:MAG: hypothetical protein QF440_04730 [Candidatus Thalassarchaeaceae archaeon]|nr:hypothetical protein [Candidatus Thalassarchaeaceae archaeon]
MATKNGSWAPFAVTFMLIAIAAIGLDVIPKHYENEEVFTSSSSGKIPMFVEHFTNINSNSIPDDGVIRLAWHTWDENLTNGLGIPAAKYRAEDLGISETGVIEHPSEPTHAKLNISLKWDQSVDGAILNSTIGIHIFNNVSDTLILRMIIIENNVEVGGRIPMQNSVVRLYRMSIAINNTAGSHTTHHEFFSISDLVEHGMSRNLENYHNMDFIILLSDYETEENLAILTSSMPEIVTGPGDTADVVSTLLGLGIILFCFGSISRAEWKREYMLPRLTGKGNRQGNPMAILKAGGGNVILHEVRINSPWKFARLIKSQEISSGTEKTFEIRVKPERGIEKMPHSIIETEWSIEVEEMGKWVLDLTLKK